MEKSSIEMDVDDWELLPVPNNNHTFFEFGLESGRDLLLSKETNYSPMAIVDNHYFILPYPKPQEISNLEDNNSGQSKDETEEDPSVVFKDIGVVPSPKAIFKKLKDDQFADMNVESHMFSTKGTITPLIGPEPILFDDKEEEFYKDEKEEMVEEQEYVDHDIKEKPCLEVFGLKVWKWKLVGGVGALCSIGVAAATICIMVLGGRNQQKYEPHSQRLQFQIYTNEKRIKQVMQHATRLNHTLTAVRGVPMTRANISFGGYYDGL